VLVPLTGQSAELGQSMLRAARLALEGGDGPAFDAEDTKSTPDGAAAAARTAVAAGAGIMVGPLTAAETAAVAPVARAGNIPVLAFTSDTAQAHPGVWTMGITPAQQVRTLVQAVQADNKSRIGALLPRGPFGDALADGLMQAAGEARLPPPQIARLQPGPAGLETALAQLAGSTATSGPAAPPQPAAPPSIDALLVGTTADATVQALPALTRYGLGPDRVRLLGTALWARDASRLSALAGAWYAGPDPQTKQVFERNYTSRYGSPPRDLASIAFDAAGAARAVTGPAGVNANALLNPNGFAGADGVFALLPDGRVLRALALFEIGANGVSVREPGARSIFGPRVM
jgi:ABC-type branched-subunit amino acid transport system substrate-binding protein